MTNHRHTCAAAEGDHTPTHIRAVSCPGCVAPIYGADVAALVGNGWTLDAAEGHVRGVCDRAICTGAHA